eukprot:69602_1
MEQCEDEDDCFYENIVAKDGKDRRQKISISPANSKDIIQCIGSLWIGFDVGDGVGTEYVLGTATVIAINKNNSCIALTAAHNIQSQTVRECPLCHTKMIKQYCYCLEQQKSRTMTHKTDQKIDPFSVQFQRRCIHVSMSIKNIHYTLGQVIKSYDVDLPNCIIQKELFNAHPLANRGYDIC